LVLGKIWGVKADLKRQKSNKVVRDCRKIKVEENILKLENE